MNGKIDELLFKYTLATSSQFEATVAYEPNIELSASLNILDPLCGW